jgi:hypothetical protein
VVDVALNPDAHDALSMVEVWGLPVLAWEQIELGSVRLLREADVVLIPPVETGQDLLDRGATTWNARSRARFSRPRSGAAIVRFGDVSELDGVQQEASEEGHELDAQVPEGGAGELRDAVFGDDIVMHRDRHVQQRGALSELPRGGQVEVVTQAIGA